MPLTATLVLFLPCPHCLHHAWVLSPLKLRKVSSAEAYVLVNAAVVLLTIHTLTAYLTWVVHQVTRDSTLPKQSSDDV